MESNKTSSKIDQSKTDDGKTSLLKKTELEGVPPLIITPRPRITLEGQKTITLGKKT